MSEDTQQNEPSPSASPSIKEDGGNEPRPEPWDRIGKDFRAFLERSGVDAALFNNPSYDKVGALATFEATQQSEKGVGHNQAIHGRFTVFVRNRHTSLTNIVKFTDRMLPVTLDEFWDITGGNLDSSKVNSARVLVKTRTGWEKLDKDRKSVRSYVLDDPELGAIFQLSPVTTPNSSPVKEEYQGIRPQVASDFQECIQELFCQNPFRGEIPELYPDPVINDLVSFFGQSPGLVDPEVVALILAMPGSGKTRTVQAAAARSNLEYCRFRMSNAKFSNTADVRRYVEAQVRRICSLEKDASIPVRGIKRVVIHFDEIQALTQVPTDDANANSMVTALVTACDALVHVPDGSWRSWLKFVLTGTNIFANTMIRADVKTKRIPMDGSFSLAFVQQIANKHGLQSFFKGNCVGYLDRGRHNRRFTEHFFYELFEKRLSNPHDSSAKTVEKAYDKALDATCEKITQNIFRLDVLPVPRVACAVFAKLLHVKQVDIVDGATVLYSCSPTVKYYIAGGGLNVKHVNSRSEDVTIFFPKGCVLELLEGMIGRRNSRHCCNTVISFLRSNQVTQFGIRGHPFEWLIAYDITAPRSEFDNVMDQKRVMACVGSVPISAPIVYDLIAPSTNVDANVWVVNNSNQNQWIDVAYSIEPPKSQYEGAYAIMVCKSGYEDKPSNLTVFCCEFFKQARSFAQEKPNYYFVATFVCEYEFPQKHNGEDPENLLTVVKVITEKSCPIISRFLNAMRA